MMGPRGLRSLSDVKSDFPICMTMNQKSAAVRVYEERR